MAIHITKIGNTVKVARDGENPFYYAADQYRAQVFNSQRVSISRVSNNTAIEVMLLADIATPVGMDAMTPEQACDALNDTGYFS